MIKEINLTYLPEIPPEITIDLPQSLFMDVLQHGAVGSQCLNRDRTQLAQVQALTHRAEKAERALEVAEKELRFAQAREAATPLERLEGWRGGGGVAMRDNNAEAIAERMGLNLKLLNSKLSS